jgi:hypothetical protein
MKLKLGALFNEDLQLESKINQILITIAMVPSAKLILP